MKIAFVGKGGSGKSTLAYRMTEYFSDKGFFVLAVDADHNMDLAHSLGGSIEGPFIGTSKQEILDHVENGKKFTLNPIDHITSKGSQNIKENIRLMVAGPHTEEILEGKKCSHSLSSPLKRYFPNLIIKKGEVVIVDEKAGSDGVGTGVLKGFDHVFVVIEPTPQSAKASDQISNILDYYKIPYSFVINKMNNEESIRNISLKKKPVHCFGLSLNMLDHTKKLSVEEVSGFKTLESMIC